MEITQHLLYHYTSGSVFKRILKQGALLPDKSEPDNKNEVPSVTFSSNPVWEKTRYRVGKLPNGQLVLMNKELLKQFDGGVFRIVIPKEIAPMDWHGMKDQLGMSQATMKGIYDFANEVGARPSEWFATTDPVSEAVWITVEKLNAKDEWVELEEDDVPELHRDDMPEGSIRALPE